MVYLGEARPRAPDCAGVAPPVVCVLMPSWGTYDRIRNACRTVLANHRARRPVRPSSGRSHGGFADSIARASSRGSNIVRGDVHTLSEAYSWDLWGAAYVVNGGCSDDGFEYFCRWLVSRGREVYESSLADPDSFAQFELQPGENGAWEFEGIHGVVQEIFEEKNSEGYALDYAESGIGFLPATGPSGEPFEEDHEYLARRYPNLWRRFGDEQLG